MKWNIIRYNWNKRKVEYYNVFDHWSFKKECDEAYEKYKTDKESFAEEVRKILQYYYWCKCEWEIVVDDFPPSEDGKFARKIDVYSQVVSNYDRFIDYTWTQYSKEV